MEAVCETREQCDVHRDCRNWGSLYSFLGSFSMNTMEHSQSRSEGSQRSFCCGSNPGEGNSSHAEGARNSTQTLLSYVIYGTKTLVCEE